MLSLFSRAVPDKKLITKVKKPNSETLSNLNSKIKTHRLHSIGAVVIHGVTAIIEAEAQRKHRRGMVEAGSAGGWAKLRDSIIQRRRLRGVTAIASEPGVGRNRKDLLEEIVGGVTLRRIR